MSQVETQSHGRKCIQMIIETSETRVISDVVKKSVWNLLNKNINSAEGVYAALED